MKIAMIGQKGIPVRYGGIERHVEELSAQLATAGSDVVVYTRPHYSDASVRTYRGVRLVSLPSVHTKHLDAITHSFMATVHAMWFERDVSVIHYHGVGPSLLAWIPRIFTPRIKVVSTFHSPDRLHAKWNWFARTVLKTGEYASLAFPHQTITVSKQLQQYSVDTYGKVSVYIPNGVSSKTHEVKDAEWLRKNFGLESKKYGIMVSRLVAHKRIEDGIAAWKKMKHPLVIVGGSAHTDEYVNALRKLADDNPNIIFTGFQSGEALHTLMAHANVFISPSENEGLPITTLEAMMARIPVVLSDIPEHMQLICDGCGITFETGNVDALAQATQTALETNSDIEAMVDRAYERMMNEYHWDGVAISVARVYEHATSNSSFVTA